ncbi:hypothetical protein BDF20DRAFT_837264 [Mycotypha africana]|uniref:uncharacterized protein n=1 Tax=Mycotypha africana TaxID=64632 RepID=UPI00230061A0|nr:uncharacterized protein BDF20DRAFT_837264 [Mycotypha africana]KAI8973311.1 hypothetical protein BDF20DRAFT_837264 [Mycotypha africana]
MSLMNGLVTTTGIRSEKRIWLLHLFDKNFTRSYLFRQNAQCQMCDLLLLKQGRYTVLLPCLKPAAPFSLWRWREKMSGRSLCFHTDFAGLGIIDAGAVRNSYFFHFDTITIVTNLRK